MMNSLREIYYGYIEEKTHGEQLYLIAFAVFILGENLRTTMFLIPGMFFVCCKLFALGLIGIKIILFGQYGVGRICWIGFMLLEGTLIFFSSGYHEPLMWILFVTSATDVAFKKILKVYAIVTFVVVFAAMIASGLDIIKNLQYQSDESRGIRNSFGIVYTTDFAAHVFFLMLTVLYLTKKMYQWQYGVICLGVTAAVYYFCDARLDSSCMVLVVLGYTALKVREQKPISLKKKYCPQGFFSRLAVFSMPAAAIVMFFLSWFYDSEIEILENINNLLSNRLSLGRRGLSEYSITLFGQNVYMLGNGSTEKLPSEAEYFFIDCSYLYNFMRYGLIFLIIILAVYSICCRKYQADQYFLLTVALISLNCMIAHHLIELAYNPFALAFLADQESFGKTEEIRGYNIENQICKI